MATSLFAARGYKGVSIRDLSRAVNLSPSTILHHIGSKEELYESIFDRLNQESQPLREQVQQARALLAANPELLPDLVDAFMEALIEMARNAPHTRQLWLRLLLEQREEFARRESGTVGPLQAGVIALFHDCRDAGVISADDDTIRFFVASVDWILDGFFLGGTIGKDVTRSDPNDPTEQKRLAGYLKRMAKSVLGIKEA